MQCFATLSSVTSLKTLVCSRVCYRWKVMSPKIKSPQYSPGLNFVIQKKNLNIALRVEWLSKIKVSFTMCKLNLENKIVYGFY